MRLRGKIWNNGDHGNISPPVPTQNLISNLASLLENDTILRLGWVSGTRSYLTLFTSQHNDSAFFVSPKRWPRTCHTELLPLVSQEQDPPSNNVTPSSSFSIMGCPGQLAPRCSRLQHDEPGSPGGTKILIFSIIVRIHHTVNLLPFFLLLVSPMKQSRTHLSFRTPLFLSSHRTNTPSGERRMIPS